MWANLHLSCVLTVKDIEFFLVESALALGNDREAEQHVIVFDNDSYYPSTRTRCYVLLRRIVFFSEKSSWILLRDIVQASKLLRRHSGVAK